MKILFINGTNKIGGGELSLLSIAKYYRKNSAVVSFDNGDYTNLLQENGIVSIVLKNAKELLNIKREDGILGSLLKIKYLFLTIFELRKLIKDYDIIYCNSQKSIFLGLLSTLFIRKKVVIHVRDMMDNPNISNFHKKIFVFLINFRRPVIIANSVATKEALISIGIKRKIEVVYNGIMIKDLKKREKEKKKKFIIAMFSRISHWKGQKYFIKAVKLLKDKKEFENMEFWIVGDALMNDKDKDYKSYILKLIKKYDLEDKIKLFGFIKNSIELMQSIDILVLPSIYPEPFGRVVVEAMLLKKVVIATNHGGVTEIIENNKSGILVDVENLAYHISESILKLYNDKEFYKYLAENGNKRAIENFTEEKMLKNIDNIIKD